MEPDYLNICLYGRLQKEQKDFRDWLLKQPAEEILNHAYEYTLREDILCAMDEMELSEDQYLALLGSEAPLANLYKYYLGLETAYMENIRSSVEDFATDVATLFAGIREQPVYKHSYDYAVAHGEEKQYWESLHANVACKDAIERAIAENYADNCMDTIASKQVVAQFGFDRTLYVLANTVQFKDWDGRFSDDNKDWAQSIQVTGGSDGRIDHRLNFLINNSHPGLVDMFLGMVRSDQERHNKKRVSVRKRLNQKAPASPKTSSQKKVEKETR